MLSNFSKITVWSWDTNSGGLTSDMGYSALPPLCYFIDSSMMDRYYLQFRDEIIEIQGGEVACSCSHS